MKAGDRFFLRVPKTPATVAAGLMALNGQRVTLERPLQPALSAPCWEVQPQLHALLQAPAESVDGHKLGRGDRVQLHAVPQAWLRVKPPCWCKADEQFVLDHYGTWLVADISAALDRGIDSVRAKALSLGLACRAKWTPELDEFLTLLFPDTSAVALAPLMGVTPAALRKRAEDLGVRKAPGFMAEHSRSTTLARSPFTPEIAETLRLRYPDTDSQQLADFVGLSLARVQAYASKHGWNKTKAFLSEQGRRLAADPGHPMRKYQFLPGQTPPNKGVKGWKAGGRSSETQFKKGSRPHTWRPLGSHRVDVDGYLIRKVADTGYITTDWKPVHRLVWEEHRGPIPEGHVVRFLPGKRTADPELLTVDRLECISQAENARRNAWHADVPPELRDLRMTELTLRRAIKKAQERLNQGNEHEQPKPQPA